MTVPPAESTGAPAASSAGRRGFGTKVLVVVALLAALAGAFGVDFVKPFLVGPPPPPPSVLIDRIRANSGNGIVIRIVVDRGRLLAGTWSSSSELRGTVTVTDGQNEIAIPVRENLASKLNAVGASGFFDVAVSGRDFRNWKIESVDLEGRCAIEFWTLSWTAHSELSIDL